MRLRERFFGGDKQRAALAPLYTAIVERARDPLWYRQGQVPDTIDGRFDMLAAILSAVLIRLEAEGDAYTGETTLLTELFVEDMEGQLRQAGIGDVVVSKHIGKMMGALGGRIGAYRDALAGDGDLGAAVERNLYRGEPADDAAAIGYARARLSGFHGALAAEPADRLLAGQLPVLR